MSNTKEVVTTCDWCLQEARVQTIEETLWRFWKIISNEDPTVTSHKKICDNCKSRYEEFSIYIERCKIYTSKIDELLSTLQVKDEPSIDIAYPPLIKTEISNEVDLNSFRPAVSSGVFIEQQVVPGCSKFATKINDSTIEEVLLAGKVKKEPFIHVEDHLMNKEDIWKKEVTDPDCPTASDGTGKAGLVLKRQVLPDSTVHQKKVNNNLTCTYCAKTFNYRYHLNIHLRSHTGDRPFKCSHCKKRFICVGALNVHLRIHTGDKDFKCLRCNEGFTRLSHFKAHLRLHTGYKPFRCSHCNKSFTLSSHLDAHLC